MKFARNLSMGQSFLCDFSEGCKTRHRYRHFLVIKRLVMPDKAMARPSSGLFSNGYPDPRYGKS